MQARDMCAAYGCLDQTLILTCRSDHLQTNPTGNLALGKTAFQISNRVPYSSARLAVDGMHGTDSTGQLDNQCASTTSVANPWWAVDLEQPYVVSYVTALASSST